MARKAVEGGSAPMARLLDRFGVSAARLAERLDVATSSVEQLVDHPVRAPLVMLDGEDAQALREDVLETGPEIAAAVFRNADWGSGTDRSLRFFRPPGLALGTTARDVHRLLWALTDGRGNDVRLPLDGIVMPKLEHPEEVDLLYHMLDRAEQELGLPVGRIRVAILVESGWAVAQLAEIARRAVPRLTGLIFGIADYAADLGLPAIATDHPVAVWARAQLVDVAGAVGVPAIDGMTLDYPVADPALDADANRERFLTRVALVHDDALWARALGMSGKWVGHPAQLFATMLAFGAAGDTEGLEREAAKLEAYRAAVEGEGRGATIIEGVMSDRATDRHARVVLRRAVASGHFDATRAVSLGVISAAERAELAG